MPLPDASRLLDLPAATWRALGERLRAIGLDLESVRPILAIAPGAIEAYRLPMRVWHARKRGDLPAHAFRMLALKDPILREKAQEILGAVPLGALVDVGLLREQDGGVASAFMLNFVNKDYVFSDFLSGHGSGQGDAAMGPGTSTQVLVGGALPLSGKVRGALDLGCGAGTLAVLLGRACESVVATDVSPRAVTLAKANVVMSGMMNIDVRQGDLFEPVAGETFDLIVAQPPFVPQPPGSEPAAYLYGGRRGDEIATRVLAGLDPHLSDRGRALVLVEWMTAAGDPGIEARVRDFVPRDLDALHLLGGRPSLDEHALSNAAVRHPALDEAFMAEAIALRTHLDTLGVTDARMVLHVFERAKGRRAFTSTLGVRGDVPLRPALVDRWMAVRDTVTRGGDALLGERVVVAPGLVLGQPDEGGQVLATPPPESCVAPMRVSAAACKLLLFVGGAPSVRAAAESLAASASLEQKDAESRVLTAASQGLLLGLLELAR